MRKVLVGMLVILSLMVSGQVGIGSSPTTVKNMLNDDTTVTNFKMTNYTVDDDNVEYFSYTCESENTIIMFKFIQLGQQWTCVRQVFSFSGDEYFDGVWSYIKSDVCTTTDSDDLCHYYRSGVKYQVYWVYKESRYMLVYERSYKIAKQ